MPADASGGVDYQPTAQDVARWSAPEVEAVRRSVTSYLYVNAVIVIGSPWVNLLFITVISTIVMALKFARLKTSHGYDWRDVFRQPRHREVIDVVEDTAADVRAIFDPNERARRREQRQVRAATREYDVARLPAPLASPSPAASAAVYGGHADRVRRAVGERDEIIRLVGRLTAAERAQVPDVIPSARALADRVESLARSLAELDRTDTGGAADMIEEEIERLEAAANPLDLQGSEERVRRLAVLKRQRRAVADLAERRAPVAARLDTCVVALETMRMDLVRLSAGGQSMQGVTTLAVQALALADSVDGALAAADEVERLAPRPSSRPRA
jgi:eukaryotic-like serine/threonine-protein kinase